MYSSHLSCVWDQTKVALCLLPDEGGVLAGSVALTGSGLLGRCPDVCRTPLLILTLRFLTSPVCFCTPEFISPSWGLVSSTHSIYIQHLSTGERSAFRPASDSWRWRRRSRFRSRGRSKGRSRGRSLLGQFRNAAFVLLPSSFSSWRK